MCFSLAWFEAFLVWVVVICVVIALLRLLLRFVVPKLGVGAEIINFVTAAITIVIWGIIIIAAIYFIFGLISCFAGSLHFPAHTDLCQ
jgi:hypothetical protein